MRREPRDGDRLDVFAVQTLDDARKRIHRDRLPLAHAEHVRKRILERLEAGLGTHFGQLVAQIGFHRFQHFGVFGSGEIIAPAQLHPAAIGGRVDQNDPDVARRLARQNRFQEHVSALAITRDGNHAGRHTLLSYSTYRQEVCPKEG